MRATFVSSGRILNLETQDMTMYSWTGSVDPDESYWAETGKQVKTYLNIIRLFYEAAPPAYERIGEQLKKRNTARNMRTQACVHIAKPHTACTRTYAPLDHSD